MNQKNVYIIVHRETGDMLVDSARLPIYWKASAAVQKAKRYPAYIVQPISITDIEEAALVGNIKCLNKKK